MSLKKKLILVAGLACVTVLGGYLYLYSTDFCFEERRYLSEAEFCDRLDPLLSSIGKESLISCYLDKRTPGIVLNVWLRPSKKVPGIGGSRVFYFSACGSRIRVH